MLSVELESRPNVINERFKRLENFEDIAILLEIPTQLLWKILIRDKTTNYRMFTLSKKNGKDRKIYAPTNNLAILQKKLSQVLSLNFHHHYRSHGFIQGRSIVTNAKEHIQKKFVLNFDLENFFENIKFSRVRNMFLAYYRFNDVVATTLANICCHPNGFLPQGAPTSPVVSNIIAKSLDKELTLLVKNVKNVQYSRYGDDITFSTKRNKFPKEIAYISKDGNTVIGQRIVNIVEKFNFRINEEKTRLQKYNERQSVTGIVVNQKPNVNRTYIRRIRSIINCIEKNLDNIEEAKKIFDQKYPFRQRKKRKKPDMFVVLRGMITHISNVKGIYDPIYMKLGKRFNVIVNKIELPYKIKPIYIPYSEIEFHEKYTFIINQDDIPYYVFPSSEHRNDLYYDLGTCFLLKGIGLVTNAHVLKTVIKPLKRDCIFDREFYIEFHTSTEYKKNWAKILCYDLDVDIAILSTKDMDIDKEGYQYNCLFEKDQPITLIGYPEYRKGQEIRIQEGFIQGRRIHSEHIRYEITATIHGGNSGGPIINKNNEVVGIAVRGATEKGVVPSEIIPISDVIELAKKHNLIN